MGFFPAKKHPTANHVGLWVADENLICGPKKLLRFGEMRRGPFHWKCVVVDCRTQPEHCDVKPFGIRVRWCQRVVMTLCKHNVL